MQILTRVIIICALLIWVVQASPTSLKGEEVPGDSSSSNSRLQAIRQAKSEEIRKYMNESVNPCGNFYQFACGNWKTHYPTDENNTQTDSFSELGIGEFDRKLSQLLSIPDRNLDTATEVKVKDFYGSCLKLGSLKQSEYNAKTKEILKEFGQMPALVEDDKWQEQDFDWLKTIAEMSYKYGITIIVGHSIVPDYKDHTTHNIFLRSQEFTIQNNFDSQRHMYELNVVKRLKTHLDLVNTMAEKIAKELVELEVNLWKAQKHDIETKSEEISMEEAQDKYSGEFDVKKLFKISYVSIPANVIIDICPYIESLIDIMKTTPRRVVANYIFYSFLEAFIVKIPDDKDKLQEKCINKVEEYFPKVVSYLFYRKNNLKENEKEFDQIWQNMKSTLGMAFESSNLTWFDDDARESALDKLHSIQLVVPSYEENNFEQEYANITINPGDYLENVKSLKIFKAAQTRDLLNTMPDYIDHALDIYTPIYVQSGNVAIVPVSVLQNDFFWSKFYPKALNYGHIGFVIGHEVLHGFSALGHRFDSLGNFAGEWNIEEEFEERRQCLYDQYLNYTVGGHPLPQDDTQEENTTDNGGILLAYASYMRWYDDPVRTKSELELETLPRLSYDHKQLFFISYAQFWCADTYETQRSLIAAADDHSPEEFRTIVPLTNLHEFSKAFQCPKGSPMNPENKCEVY